MLTVLTFIGAAIVMVLLIAWTYTKQTSQSRYDAWGQGVGCSIAGLLVCVFGLIAVLGYQYQSAISMPLRLDALNATIVEQTELLASDATLGQGLEGLEIKREIQQTIRERNELIANMETRRRSAWYLFKPAPSDKEGG